MGRGAGKHAGGHGAGAGAAESGGRAVRHRVGQPQRAHPPRRHLPRIRDLLLRGRGPHPAVPLGDPQGGPRVLSPTLPIVFYQNIESHAFHAMPRHRVMLEA